MNWTQDIYGNPEDPWDEDGDFFLKKYEKVKQFEQSQGITGNPASTFREALGTYINGETYTVTMERNNTDYVLEISGRFRFGGEKTYRGEIDFRKTPVWHYNNTVADAPKGKNSRPLRDLGLDWNAWPEDSAYPDYFMFGDPHIAHYEGTVQYDDLEFWVRP